MPHALTSLVRTVTGTERRGKIAEQRAIAREAWF